MNRQRTNRIDSGFSVEVSTEGTQLSYTNFNYLGQEPHYWQLPNNYQGDKVEFARVKYFISIKTNVCLSTCYHEVYLPLWSQYFATLLFLQVNPTGTSLRMYLK